MGTYLNHKSDKVLISKIWKRGAWVAQALRTCLQLSHDPRVLGLSPAWGSLFSGKTASPSPTPPAGVPSLAVSLSVQ